MRKKNHHRNQLPGSATRLMHTSKAEDIIKHYKTIVKSYEKVIAAYEQTWHAFEQENKRLNGIIQKQEDIIILFRQQFPQIEETFQKTEEILLQEWPRGAQ